MVADSLIPRGEPGGINRSGLEMVADSLIPRGEPGGINRSGLEMSLIHSFHGVNRPYLQNAGTAQLKDNY
jgi:hypothetical protein